MHHLTLPSPLENDATHAVVETFSDKLVVYSEVGSRIAELLGSECAVLEVENKI